MKPKFSIITVSFNSEKTIKDTFESVLNQTDNNFEYIVVDGNSIDHTIDIIKKYKEKFIQKNIDFKWLSEPDNGIYDAMNKGVNISEGEYVSFINSDDWYDKEAIENISNASVNKKADIFYGDITFIKENGSRILKKPKPLKMLKKGQNIFFPSIFINKKILKEHEPFDPKYKLASDYKFLLENYILKNKFVYVPSNLSYYRLGGSTTKQIYNSWKEVMIISKSLGVNELMCKIYFYEKVIKRYILNFLK